LALAEAGLKSVAKVGIGMNRSRPRDQRFFGFDVVWISNANVHRTDRRASFIIVKTDAFGAEFGIDDEDRGALRYSVVGTLWLARAAIDAVVGNHRRHEFEPPKNIDGIGTGVKIVLS
jgi:hypothetical protein